ncbi:MAG: FkbM family methyltransferase [Methanobacterium sp.]
MSYGLHGIDNSLLKYLNFRNGVFIEAGANDGVSQSNTALYEFEYGWTGLLIEPNPKKFFECKNIRKNSIVENYALVSDNYSKDFILGNFDEIGYGESLTAMVYDNGDWVDEHLLEHKNSIKEKLIEVPAITLNKLLAKHNITKINFVSLDVEGYEISFLNGFDLKKYKPEYIMIETTTFENRRKVILDYMEEKGYTVIDELSCNDVLFTIK